LRVPSKETRVRGVLMTEKSPLIGSRRAADILQSASATHKNASDLKMPSAAAISAWRRPQSGETRLKQWRNAVDAKAGGCAL
jgi:hypothetical protein